MRRTPPVVMIALDATCSILLTIILTQYDAPERVLREAAILREAWNGIWLAPVD